MKPKGIINLLFIFLLACVVHTNSIFANEGKSEGKSGSKSEGGGESQANAIKDKSRYLLATIREGDFPYIGGSEAINLIMGKLVAINPLLNKGNTLEIGGGHGGNANYLKAQGFAKIQVIDIDEEAIKYAKVKYPDINFKLLDAGKITSVLEENSFNLVYMLGSAHAIGDKLIMLQRIKVVSKTGALLAIMDYNLKEAKESDKLLTPTGETIYPLNMEKIISQMGYIGWEVVENS